MIAPLICILLSISNCREYTPEPPLRIKFFDLIIADKDSGNNLIGSVYPIDEISISDFNGETRWTGSFYGNQELGHVVDEIIYDLGEVVEYKVQLIAEDVDTLRVQRSVAKSEGFEFYFYYNDQLIDSVKSWREWNRDLNKPQPLIRATK